MVLATLSATGANASPSTAASVAAVNSAVTDPSIQLSSVSAGATQVTYSVSFRTVHALVWGKSTIMLAFPAHARLDGTSCYELVTDDAAESAGCNSPAVKGQVLTTRSPVAASPGDMVTVTVGGVTNPPSDGLHSVLLSTSSDPEPVPLYVGLAPSTAVGDATLQLSSSSALAPRVTYSVTFRSPDRFIASNNQEPAITLVAPAGTVFPPGTCGAYELIDDTETTSGGCGPSIQLSRSGATVTVRPGTTAPGDLLTLVVRGVVNPAALGLRVLTLSTSADPRPVPLHYVITAAQAVFHPFLQLSSYAGSTTGATWSVGFSSPDRLTGFGDPTGDSTMTLVAPAGTVFPPQQGCNDTYTFVDPIDGIDHCAVGALISDGGSKLVVRPLEGATSPGAVMALVIKGVKNPPAPGRLQVWTTSDPRPVTLPTSGPTTTGPVLQLDASSARGTSVTYAATFRLASGFNAANCPSGGSKLILSAPAGTVFPVSGYVLYDLANGTLAGAGACPPKSTTYVPGSTIPLATGIASGNLSVTPGDFFAVVATAVTSTTSAGRHHLLVSASTGTAVDPSYDLTSPSRVRSPLLQALSSAAGARGVHYAVTFEATNGLFPNNSAITLSLPGAAWGPGSGDNDSWDVYDDTTGLAGGGYAAYGGRPAAPNATDNPGPAVVTPSTGDGFRADPGDIVTVATDGTVNPSGPGAHVLTLSTSGDPAPVALPLVLAKPGPASLAVVDLSSYQPGAKGVTFALSFVTHASLTPNWSSVLMTFAGVTWPPGVGDGDGFSVYDDTTALNGGGYATVNGNSSFKPFAGTPSVFPSTGDGFYGAPGDVITVISKTVTNPSGPGAHAVAFSSSTDPATSTAPLVLKGP
jgi:hypothetical protein